MSQCSVKRELKKQKPKKEDSDGDAPNETAQEEQEAPIEQEKIVLFYTCGYLPHVQTLCSVFQAF